MLILFRIKKIFFFIKSFLYLCCLIHKKMKNLSHVNKLSDLINIALNDLEVVEQMPEIYKVDMGNWHGPQYDGEDVWRNSSPIICAVCFAGCVMANTLKCNPNDQFHPSFFDSDTKLKLVFLDHIRNGFIDDALCIFYSKDNISMLLSERGLDDISFDYLFIERYMYNKDPKGFKEKMCEMATILSNYDL